AVLPLRRIGIAGVAARSVAVDAVAVVPAARVLAEIAAESGGIADLRARDAAGCVREQTVLLSHDGRTLALGERGERADLEPFGRLADPLETLDSAEIDDRFRALHAVLEPIQAVVPAGDDPAVAAEPFREIERVLEAVRL